MGERKTLKWDKVEGMLTGAGVRAVGRVRLRECTYCGICGAVVADHESHDDFHAAVIALFGELRRQSSAP